MIDKKIIKIISLEYPVKSIELQEGFEWIADTIDEVFQNISNRTNNHYSPKIFEKGIFLN